MTSEPKFFCDEQLGKLARWMRILGLDTAFARGISDDELLGQAGDDGRIVLTRDTRLGEKSTAAAVVRLTENYPFHQLREVMDQFGDRVMIRLFSRCPVCNGEVEAAAKAEVQERVPPYVFQSQERFTRCRSCGQIYWQATHRERILRQLREALGEKWPSQAAEK